MSHIGVVLLDLAISVMNANLTVAQADLKFYLVTPHLLSSPDQLASSPDARSFSYRGNERASGDEPSLA